MTFDLFFIKAPRNSLRLSSFLCRKMSWFWQIKILIHLVLQCILTSISTMMIPERNTTIDNIQLQKWMSMQQCQSIFNIIAYCEFPFHAVSCIFIWFSFFKTHCQHFHNKKNPTFLWMIQETMCSLGERNVFVEEFRKRKFVHLCASCAIFMPFKWWFDSKWIFTHINWIKIITGSLMKEILISRFSEIYIKNDDEIHIFDHI